MKNQNSGVGTFIAGVLLVIFVVTAWSTYYTVDQGERVVYLHNGAFGGVSEPGLSLSIPFITSVKHISVRPFVMTYGGQNGLGASSKDQQVATIRVSVNMHVGVADVEALYVGYQSIDGARETLVDPKVYANVKNVFGQFDAADAIQQRAKLSLEVEAAIKRAITGPITIDTVQIENISFSEDYNRAVEERMAAQVAAVKAEAQKQQKIIEADASAYQVKAAADADAHRIEVKGRAEAVAITVRAQALANNSQLVALQTVERWDGHLPVTMVPGGSVPILNLQPH